MKKSMLFKKAVIMIVCMAIVFASLLPVVFINSQAEEISYELPNPSQEREELRGAINVGNNNPTFRDTDNNSYGWAMEVFNGYLWLGTNRDLGALVIVSAITDALSAINPALAPLATTFAAQGAEAFGQSFDPHDQAGRIYRMSLVTGEWEYMFSHPAINGYRQMLLFQGELFVFAGITSRNNFTRIGTMVTSSLVPHQDWSAIFRFNSEFEQGDVPEIVLWDELYGDSFEYFRAGVVVQDDEGEDKFLYIGTASGRVWRTNGENFQPIFPSALGQGQNRGSLQRHAGWQLVSDLVEDEMVTTSPGGLSFGTNMVWDLISFDGSVYAFMTGGSGFEVVRMTENTAGHDLVQIVGSRPEAIYPSGLGISAHVAASPFLFNIDGEYFVYVTTFSNGPAFMGALAAFRTTSLLAGGLDLGIVTLPPLPHETMLLALPAFTDIFQAANMYRFNAYDEWEVIVGETSSILGSVAINAEGNPAPFADGANTRAGFFPGILTPNSSANMYIWWMEQCVRTGRLFASTWDMGNFRSAWQGGLDDWARHIFNASQIEALTEAAEQFTESVVALVADIVQNIAQMSTELASEIAEGIQENIEELIQDAMLLLADIENVNFQDIQNLLLQFVSNVEDTLIQIAIDTITNFELSDIVSLELISEVLDAAENLGEVTLQIVASAPDLIQSVSYFVLISAVMSLYLNDTSNPDGFDLFYSYDGITWHPFTVTGFGYANNYGGRVILSTDYGLFVTTANPFTGFQIWNIDADLTPSITVSSITNTKEGNTITTKIEVVANFMDGEIEVITSHGRYDVESISTMKEVYIPAVETVFDLTVLGGFRFYGCGLTELPQVFHEIVLTFDEGFRGEVTVTVEINGIIKEISFLAAMPLFAVTVEGNYPALVSIIGADSLEAVEYGTVLTITRLNLVPNWRNVYVNGTLLENTAAITITADTTITITYSGEEMRTSIWLWIGIGGGGGLILLIVLIVVIKKNKNKNQV